MTEEVQLIKDYLESTASKLMAFFSMILDIIITIITIIFKLTQHRPTVHSNQQVRFLELYN